jgi:hypothetical protein
MMNWKIGVLIGGVLLAAGIVFFLLRIDGPEPTPVAPSTAPEPVVTGKDVNLQVQVTRRAMRPSEITVEAGDRVYLYLTALDEGITVFRPSTAQEIALPRDTVQTIIVIAGRDEQILCTQGCAEGVTFTVKSS